MKIALHVYLSIEMIKFHHILYNNIDEFHIEIVLNRGFASFRKLLIIVDRLDIFKAV